MNSRTVRAGTPVWHVLILSLIFHLSLVFFTHNNPGRMIIHKPSFSAALTHEQLPSYLVLAVCANAAPYSKDATAKAPTQRLAGVPFFQEAVSIMFDASGRLLAEPNLATAQALCLLELHEVSASHSWTKHYRYFGKQALSRRVCHGDVGY